MLPLPLPYYISQLTGKIYNGAAVKGIYLFQTVECQSLGTPILS